VVACESDVFSHQLCDVALAKLFALIRSNPTCVAEPQERASDCRHACMSTRQRQPEPVRLCLEVGIHVLQLILLPDEVP